MDQPRDIRFSIDQEMKRRGKIFQRRIAALSVTAAAPRTLKLLAHGDSWFDYPIDGNDITAIGATDVIHQLDPNSTNDEGSFPLAATAGPQFIIHNASHRGDATTDEMSMVGRKYMRDALDNYWGTMKPDAILFSGGGNDIVGPQFAIYLDYAPPPQGSIGLNIERFNGALARIEASYKSLIDFRDRFAHGVRIFTHCYDYALPNGTPAPCNNGPWLEPSLQDSGYADMDACRAIVRRAIDLFYARISQIASTTPLFYVVDTRGTLVDSDWANELHPFSKGFAKIADKFRTTIGAHFQNNV